MSIDTLIIISITAGIHVVGLGLFLLWMAVGYPTSVAKFRKGLREEFWPFRRRQPPGGEGL